MFSVKVEFDKDPLKVTEALTGSIRRVVIRKALNKAASVVKASMIDNSPDNTGMLRKSMRIKVKNYKNSDTWVAIVGPKSDYQKTKGVRVRGKHKGDPIVIKPSKYAKLVALGTRRTKPQNFPQKALDATTELYFSTLYEAINKGVAEALAK